jgi:type IV pilus assembly protein PilE
MKRGLGFSLVELLVVVAIIGILAAIAVPQYSDYVTRSKITEATATLSEHRVRMEQFFQDNRTYAGACTAGTVAPVPTGRYFTYACSALTATTFTVTATGVAAEGMNGFVFTINQANTRATTGVPAGWATNTTCWVTKKGGVC